MTLLYRLLLSVSVPGLLAQPQTVYQPPVDRGGWSKFDDQSSSDKLKRRPKKEEEYDWDALCAEQGYDIIFLYQRHFSVPAERMLKQAEGGWRNVLLKDEEVSFNWKWKDYYKELPVTNLVLAVDERGVVFTPLKTSYGRESQWDEVGRLHRKSWFKRRIIPVLKGTEDGAWHAFFMLFGH